MGKMFLDEDESLFDTPRLKYYELRNEFDRKYLNPAVWKYKYGTKESIRSFNDLLRYLEKTEEFRELDLSLSTDIPTDNVHLVLDILPFPRKLREDLIDHVIAGNVNFREQSHQDQLQKIKSYFENKKRSGLIGLEQNYRLVRDCQSSLNEKTNFKECEAVKEDEKRAVVKFMNKRSVKAKVSKNKFVKDDKKPVNKKSAIAGKEKSEAESTKENEKFVKVEVMKHKFVKDNKKKPVHIKNSVNSVISEIKESVKADKKNHVKKEGNIKKE